jgi:hypothetical protein
MDRPAPFALLKALPALLLLVAGSASAAGWNMEALVGTASPTRWWDPRTNWSVHAMYEFDQMVLVGPGIGYEGATAKPAGMADAKLQVRLPVGRQLLPYLAAEAGAALRPHVEDTWFLWRTGGGLDLKLGDRSCLLVEGGRAALSRWYARAGLLLDI